MVHPNFLWALLFLAIPIIVHLFNLRRYKKVYFSNTSVLKNILQETQKMSKLKKRLLLLSRLLAIFFIVLSFVQPYFSDKSKSSISGQPIVSIYIDNSFSMESPSGQKTALEDAKSKALEIIKSTQNEAIYQILSNDFKGQQLQLVSYAEAKDMIQKLSIQSHRKTSDEIWSKQLKVTASNPSKRKIFYWLSDFQRNQFKEIEDGDYTLNCIPISHTNLSNVWIDTAYILAPLAKINQEVQIVFRLKKSEKNGVTKSLMTLMQNGSSKYKTEVVWGDKNVLVDTFPLKIISSDWQHIQLSLSEPSIAFDNDYYINLFVHPKPYVISVTQGADQRFLNNALKADDNFDIKTFPNFDIPITDFQNSQLVILNQLSSLPSIDKLNAWLKASKQIVIFPPIASPSSSYNATLDKLGLQSLGNLENQQARIKQFNTQDVLLQDIFTQLDKLTDFPTFKSYYMLDNYANRSREVLISFDNGLPFLIKYSRPGEGNIYLFAAPVAASNSDFVYSSIFAPLMFKLGAVSTGFQINSYFIGNTSSLKIPVSSNTSDNVYRISGENMNTIPPQRKIGNLLYCTIDGSLESSGFYIVENMAGKKEYEIALNHNRLESDMQFLKSSELSDVLRYEHLKVDVNNANYLQDLKSFSGVNLWKLWIILALLFLAMEMLIVLFWDKWLGNYQKTQT